MNTEMDIVALCAGRRYVYIYGAGKHANIMIQRLRSHGIEVSSLIVSKREDAGKTVRGIPIVAAEDFLPPTDYVVLTTLKGQQIIDKLLQCKIRNVYFLSSLVMENLQERAALELYCGKCGMHLVNDSGVEKWYHLFAVLRDEEEYHWRISYTKCPKDYDISADEIFPCGTILEEFEREYGTYQVMERHVQTGYTEKKCNVYMACCHMDRGKNEKKLPDWIVPLQVGAALTDQRMGFLCDNEGDNISDRNVNYSECTGIYWVWKNDKDSDYVGLCHYRRHFAVDKNPVYELEMRKIDILVTTPTFAREGVKRMLLDVFPVFTAFTCRLTMEAIRKFYPDYLQSANNVLEGRFYAPCNIFLMKRSVFDEYCKFVFGITFEIERCYAEYGYHFQDRHMGYFVEILLNVFMVRHKDEYKIAYADMECLRADLHV